MRLALIPLVTLALAVPATARDDGRRPFLDLRAAPRISFSPSVVLMTAELKGGDDLDEYYCPTVEWEWDDGSRSTREGDCPPFEQTHQIERRFTAEHAYPLAGEYNVKVTLSRAGRVFASRALRVSVKPGAGDMSDVGDGQ